MNFQLVKLTQNLYKCESKPIACYIVDSARSKCVISDCRALYFRILCDMNHTVEDDKLYSGQSQAIRSVQRMGC